MKKMNASLSSILFLAILLLWSCGSEPDFEKMENEILDLHNSTLRAHLDKDPEFFVQDLAEEYFSVSKGQVRHPGKQEIYNQFSSYLNKVEFSQYRDLEDPIIGFSDDGSLAWSIVRVKVAGKKKIDVDSVKHFKTTWAWITLYKKEGNKWLRMGEVSSHD